MGGRSAILAQWDGMGREMPGRAGGCDARCWGAAAGCRCRWSSWVSPTFPGATRQPCPCQQHCVVPAGLPVNEAGGHISQLTASRLVCVGLPGDCRGLPGGGTATASTGTQVTGSARRSKGTKNPSWFPCSQTSPPFKSTMHKGSVAGRETPVLHSFLPLFFFLKRSSFVITQAHSVLRARGGESTPASQPGPALGAAPFATVSTDPGDPSGRRDPPSVLNHFVRRQDSASSHRQVLKPTNFLPFFFGQNVSDCKQLRSKGKTDLACKRRRRGTVQPVLAGFLTLVEVCFSQRGKFFQSLKPG